jgi:hypothetical protein
VEELTRALTCGDESRVDSAKERAALLQQLHGAEQVRLRKMQLTLLIKLLVLHIISPYAAYNRHNSRSRLAQHVTGAL